MQVLEQPKVFSSESGMRLGGGEVAVKRAAGKCWSSPTARTTQAAQHPGVVVHPQAVADMRPTWRPSCVPTSTA